MISEKLQASTRLRGKVALVTGAARGIGQATAIELASQGASLILCDILDQSIGACTIKAVERLGAKLLYWNGDVGDRSSMEEMFKQARRQFGWLDILVNNAALSIRKPLLDLQVEDMEKVWSATLWGVFHCSQLAARQMVEQGGGGSIVAISSVLASRPWALSTAYNGAKAAVNQMVRTWAVELAPHRIRVNAVEPGWTDTPGERSFATEEEIQEGGHKLPLGRLAQPKEIAQAVSFLVSDEATYITGASLCVDGAISLVR